MIPAHIEHTFKAIDRILNVSSKGPQQPMPGTPALVERPSPCADLGTAEVSNLYPVTCEARYYDAASRILESDPHLCTHDNADELGHVIQKWMEETRNSWEPR
jgi:hypothetical protein